MFSSVLRPAPRARHLVPWALLGLWGLSSPAWAQKPGEPERAGRPSAGPGKGAKPKEKDAPIDEIRVKSETQGGDAAHYWWRGFVDLVAGSNRIQADSLDLFQSDRPDGTQEKRVVAEGNVVFLQGDERVAGDKLEMDLNTGQGTFQNALGYVEPGVFVEARVIERVDPRTYRVQGGKFTSCAQPNPRWGFSASAATIHLDDKVTATNVVFKVKSVPAFYFPYFIYPIRDDQRATGFLLPHVGYSSDRGFLIGSGFFWAMGRSADQTFYADNYSKFGYGFGHELRYTADAPSRGTFRTYVFFPKTGENDHEYDIDWRGRQQLPGKFRADVQIRQYSSFRFQGRIQDSLNQASVRNRTSSVALQRTFLGNYFQVFADDSDWSYGDITRVNRHLPTATLSRSPGKIGKTPFAFGYEAKAEVLGTGDQDRVDKYSRIDLHPQISLPLNLPFLTLTPRLEGRYTRYGASVAEEDGRSFPVGPGIDRRFAEASLEMRGPTFSRVFNRPGGFYTEKIKHVIGPEVTYTRRTKIEDLDLIPIFDGDDYLRGTNQVQYSLVQRLLAKRPSGASGKLVPYEFLSWRVGQTYYVDIANGQNAFDPNYSSAVFGPDQKPAHYSPLQSRLRVRPVPNFSTNLDVEYDVNFRKVRSISVSANTSGAWGRFTGSLYRSERLVFNPSNPIPVQQTARGNTLLKLPAGFSLEGSADYDLTQKILYQSRGAIRYEMQCCGFAAEVIRFNYNQRQEQIFRFSIELANVGSIGNFNGDARGNANANQRGFGGYR